MLRFSGVVVILSVLVACGSDEKKGGRGARGDRSGPRADDDDRQDAGDDDDDDDDRQNAGDDDDDDDQDAGDDDDDNLADLRFVNETGWMDIEYVELEPCGSAGAGTLFEVPLGPGQSYTITNIPLGCWEADFYDWELDWLTGYTNLQLEPGENILYIQ